MIQLKKCFEAILIIIFLNSGTMFSQSSIKPNYVDSLLLNREYRNAAMILNEVIQTDSTNITYLYKLGLAYQGMYNFSKASPVLIKASRLNSNNIEILIALANNYKQLGNDRIAASVYHEITEKDPGNSFASNELGKLFIENQNYDAAENIYRDLIKTDSVNGYYYKQLAFCRYKKEKIDDAIIIYKKALELNPFDSGTMLKIAQLHFRKERYDSSFNYVKRGIELNPGSLPLNKLGAEVLFKMQKYSAAVTQLKVLLMMGDSSASVFQKLGFCNYYLHTSSIDSTESENCLSAGKSALHEAYRKDNEDPLTTLYLGLCYKDKKEYETAIDFFKETLDLIFPDYLSDVYTHLGASYELSGKNTEAVKSYKEALSFDDSKKILIFQLATIYDRLYSDRMVPLLYYRKFLKESNEVDEKIAKYVESRIEKLMEENHFRGNLH